MIKVNIEQGSDEWFIEKAGKVSASNFDKIITTSGKTSSQRNDYLYQLAGEKITGIYQSSYQNQAMIEGIEKESDARNMFEFLMDTKVEQTGMVYKDETHRVLCSPDGLLDKCGLEIKCPLLKTHVSYLIDDKLPTKYFCQVQGSMYVTGYQKWWFMSYFPGMPVFKILVERDNDFIDLLDKEVKLFLKDLAEVTMKLKGK